MAWFVMGKEVRCDIVFYFISKMKNAFIVAAKVWCSDSASEVRSKLYLLKK